MFKPTISSPFRLFVCSQQMPSWCTDVNFDVLYKMCAALYYAVAALALLLWPASCTAGQQRVVRRCRMKGFCGTYGVGIGRVKGEFAFDRVILWENGLEAFRRICASLMTLLERGAVRRQLSVQAAA